MVHIARSKQFLDTPSPPVQIRCKNSPVFIGLNHHFMLDFARTILSLRPAKAKSYICIRP